MSSQPLAIFARNVSCQNEKILTNHFSFGSFAGIYPVLGVPSGISDEPL